MTTLADLPEHGFTFEVELPAKHPKRHGQQKMGIDVMLVSGGRGCGLLVEAVNDGGAVHSWNQRSNDPRRVVRTGDYIVQVNGVERDVSALAAALRTTGPVRFTVLRGEDTGQSSARGDLNRRAPRSIDADINMVAAGSIPGRSNPAVGGYPWPLGHPGDGRQPRGAQAWPNQMQGPDNAQLWGGTPPGQNYMMNQPAVAAGPVPRGDVEGRIPPNAFTSWLTNATVGGGLGSEVPRAGLPGPEAAAQAGAPFIFEVVLQKPAGGRLGIDVRTAGGCDLRVRKVSKGCVDDWNQTCPKANRVCPGDRIICVNGIKGSFKLVWEELRIRTRRELRITMLRNAFGEDQNFEEEEGEEVEEASMEGIQSLGDIAGAFMPPGMSDGGGISGNHPDAVVNLPRRAVMASSGDEPPVEHWGRPGVDSSAASGNSGSLPFPREPGFLGLLGGFGQPGAEDHQPALRGATLGAPAGPAEESLRFEVLLEPATNQRIGVDIVTLLDGFVVENVKEGGRVHAWNMSSKEPYKVRAGDCIIQINGVCTFDGLTKMSDEFSNDGRAIKFTVNRKAVRGTQPQGQVSSKVTRKAQQRQQALPQQQDPPQRPVAAEKDQPSKEAPRQPFGMPFGMLPPPDGSSDPGASGGLSQPDTPPPMPTRLFGAPAAPPPSTNIMLQGAPQPAQWMPPASSPQAGTVPMAASLAAAPSMLQPPGLGGGLGGPPPPTSLGKRQPNMDVPQADVQELSDDARLTAEILMSLGGEDSAEELHRQLRAIEAPQMNPLAASSAATAPETAQRELPPGLPPGLPPSPPGLPPSMPQPLEGRVPPSEPPPSATLTSFALAAGPPPEPPPPAPAHPVPDMPVPPPPGLAQKGPPPKAAPPSIDWERVLEKDDAGTAASPQKMPRRTSPSGSPSPKGGPAALAAIDSEAAHPQSLSCTDQVLQRESSAGSSGRGRGDRGVTVAPIGAGRGDQMGKGTASPSPTASLFSSHGSGKDLAEAAEVMAESSEQGVGKERRGLLETTTQLNDQDLTGVLKAVLTQKPWLRSPISKALQGPVAVGH